MEFGRKAFTLLFLTFFGSTTFATPHDIFFDQEKKLEIFDRLVKEMERLDAEGLYVRRNRPNSWNEITKKLSNQLKNANTQEETLLVFEKLDYAFPNLHSSIEFSDEISNVQTSPLILNLRIGGEWVKENQVKWVIQKIYEPVLDDVLIGDEIIAINHLPTKYWSDLNFSYCKLPLQTQCDMEIMDNFLGRILPKKQDQKVTYTLKRGTKTWDVDVKIIKKPMSNPKDYTYLECGSNPNRYPGFTLVYQGNRACVFQSNENPKTAILRITSFSYKERKLLPGQSIRKISTETKQLYSWWKDHAVWDHLLIDVIDNNGGNFPLGYYEMLFQNPFQEQYFQLKKFNEVEKDEIQDGIFWGEKAHKLWLQDLVNRGIFRNTPFQNFLPKIPMFCKEFDSVCDESLFQVKEHPFRGKVSILLDEWCISSCDGFVYTLKEQLQDRVKLYGHPQAADTSFSRVAIEFFKTSESNFDVQIVPIDSNPHEKMILRQTVPVTRSVDRNGKIMSGNPSPLDRFVPYTLENSDSWVQEVLNTALNQN